MTKPLTTDWALVCQRQATRRPLRPRSAEAWLAAYGGSLQFRQEIGGCRGYGRTRGMATAARDRLARTLRGDAQTAFSVELTAKTDDLNLEVEGFGHVRFPVTPAKARKLLGLGQPARFGRGEETLSDPDVRDTWEIPKHLVRAEWNDGMLKVILATVKEELGVPNAAELTADLHSLLVYEPNQFF